jgi:hypothetical protein
MFNKENFSAEVKQKGREVFSETTYFKRKNSRVFETPEVCR